MGIAARRRKPYKVSTTDSKHSYPVVPNLLDRQFSADSTDEKWLTDITYIPTKEGWLYLATVLDVCSRRVVDWAMTKTWTRDWSRRLGRWPLPTGSLMRECFITQTEAASMRHTTIKRCSVLTGWCAP
jgi:putative transposase